MSCSPELGLVGLGNLSYVALLEASIQICNPTSEFLGIPEF